MVINSKLLNKLKSDFVSASLYIKEFIFFILLTSAAILLIVKDSQTAFTLIFFIVSIGFLTLMFIGRSRNRELNEIKTIINNIRKQKYSEYDEITLNKNLAALEKAIKKMFRKSKDDIEYLRKLQVMRSQFIANVSHELRTPIFTIQGYIETLLDGAVNDASVNLHFLQKAKDHTINLSNLLNDLIDISMIESGEMRMSYRYFKINPYLKEIYNELKPLADEKKLKLIYQPVDDEIEVFGDKEKLKQVFINLVQNAIKYTEEGSVEILAEDEKKIVKISIKDTGIGIPKDQQKRIFERFYRVDKARSRSVGGTGLGLAIVKHIIEAHGAQIKVESEPGQGSEFSFELKK